MQNYANILRSIRRMTGAPYYQAEHQLDVPYRLYMQGFRTPDRSSFGEVYYGDLHTSTPLTDQGLSHGRIQAPYGDNRYFIGASPVKGVFGGIVN